MFIKLIQQGRTDSHSRYECLNYTALTKADDPFIMQFMVCIGDKDWKEILVDKKEFIVYIESDSGITYCDKQKKELQKIGMKFQKAQGR